MAALSQVLDGIATQPRLDNGVAAEGQVPGGDHLLPDKWRQARGTDLGVGKVDELLQQGLQDGGLVALDVGVEHGVVSVELVTTGVEVCAVWSDARQKVVEQGVEEAVHLGVVDGKGTARWLGAVVLVRHLFVGNNEIAVSELDNTDMARHIDFRNDLNTAGDTVLENASKVCRSVDEAGVVGTGLGQLRQRGDHQRPRLRVGDVQVQAVKLVPRHGVNGPLNVINGLIVTGKVKHDTTVGVLGCVCDGHGCLSGVVERSSRVLVEKLREGLEGVQHTSRRLGTDVDLSILGNGQRVRLINVSGARLERLGSILSSLLD